MKETDGRRVARVEKEVQLFVAQYLLQHLNQELPAIVTVSRVKMPGDLKSAKVYVSFLNLNIEEQDSKAPIGEEIIDEMLGRLQEESAEIQHQMNKKLKLRYCPKIKFFQDETTETALKVDSLLHKLGEKK